MSPITSFVTTAALALSLGVATASVAFAQGGGAPRQGQVTCQPGQPNCPQNGAPSKGQKAAAPSRNDNRAAPQQAQQQGRKDQPGQGYAENAGQQAQRAPGKTPHVGDSGRGGKPFKQAHNSRFPAPPRGQEYRVVNDNLVLVDKDSLAVVGVLGLLSSLLN